MSDQVPRLDLDQATDWIAALHGRTGGWVSICAINPRLWTNPPSLAVDLADSGSWKRIAAFLEEHDRKGAHGLYVRLTSLTHRPDGGRGTADDSLNLPGLWMDGDIAGPGHKHVACLGGAACYHPQKDTPAFGTPGFKAQHRRVRHPLPADQDAMWAVAVEAGYELPTVFHHSGGGLNGYWLLDEPRRVTGGDKGAEAALSARLHDELKHAAARLGLHYGPLGDMARVMRLPGTRNRKPEMPGGAQMCRTVPGGTGRRFTWDELTGMVERAEARTAAALAKAETTVTAAPPAAAPDRPRLVQANSPIDDFNARADWMTEILLPAGWSEHSRPGAQIWVTRPGKDPADGHSAVINGTGTNLLRMFSSDDPTFEQGEWYTKAGAWRELYHGGAAGDPGWAETIRGLRARGFGDPLPPTAPATPSGAPDVDMWATLDTDAPPPDTAGPDPEEMTLKVRAEKLRKQLEDERIRREVRRIVDREDMTALQATRRLRLVDGWEFLQEDPEDEDAAIWGNGPQWLWAPGEPMMLFGGNGVYKSTLSHLLVFARLGLLGPDGRPRTDHRVTVGDDHPDDWGAVLGMPVRPMEHGTRLVYLAGDRPRQIRRAMRRHRRDWMHEILAERLIVHEGPLPFELTTNKDGLADLAMERKGSDIFVDSLKDYCPKPSEDESANGYNRARQECIARGMQWVEDHHNRKIAQGQPRTNGIEDVYGSRWLTAGAGSVVSMWCDEEGAPMVHVKQVKSPGEFVPELEVTVDKRAGTMGASAHLDPISFIRAAGLEGVTVAQYMRHTGLTQNNARNQLNTRAKQGLLEKVTGDLSSGTTGDGLMRYRTKVGVRPQTPQKVHQEDGLGDGAPW